MTPDLSFARSADPRILRRTLEGLGAVTERETHGSTVFFVGDRAYKLRKPLHFDGIDLRSSRARSEASRRALPLGETLAPGIVIGSLSVVVAPGGEGYVLAPADAPEAIDHLVEMHRYDDADTMPVRIEHRTLTGAQAREVGATIARFHRGASEIARGVDYHALLDRNFEALMPLADDHVTAIEWLALQRFATAFLIGWADVLRARATSGAVIDGHGDLRAAHVLIEGERVRIVDRREIDLPRQCDVADELGTLSADLADLTAPPDVGEAVLAGYLDAGGAPQPEALIAFFGAYRAQLRATVALLRAGQLDGGPAATARDHALELLALSRRLGWQARGPLLLLVTGPAAAGKSTLAAALAAVSGLPVLSSDAIRGDRSIEPDDDTPASRSRVYAELASAAREGRAAIIDATFGDREVRRAFTEGLEPDRAETLLVIECQAPDDERRRRATQRAATGPGVSDDGVAQAAAQSKTFSSMDAVGGRISIDSRAPIELQVDAVASWLDSSLATGRWA